MPKSIPELMLVDIKVDKRSEKPIYHQLYECIRNVILSGTIRAGQRLPATRQLASELGISRNIVSLAFEQLAIEGFLYGKTGSGTFVSQAIPDTFIKTQAKVNSTRKAGASYTSFTPTNLHSSLKRNRETEEIVPFQNAVPAMDHFPFTLWTKIATKAFKQLDSMHLGYGDARGYAPLRESIASYLRTARGVRCEADQILITSGTQQALSLCSHLLLRKGNKVIIEDPGYVGARLAFENYGAKLLPAPVDHDGVNVDFIKSNYRSARLIYVTPGQQYPLGGTLSIGKRLDLLEYAAREGSWIVEDDYDSEFKYKGRPLAALQGLDEHGKVIYMGTFSKVLFPGLRMGYMVLPTPAMADDFASVRAVFDRQHSLVDQHILTTFLNEGHFIRHLRKMRLLYYERQAMLIRAIDKDMGGKITVHEQDAGMHLIGWLNARGDDKEVSELLSSNGIIAHPLSDYSLHFKRKPALILGYTAFNKFKIRANVQRMDAILSRHQTR